jgi:hypothetical protein
MKYEEKKSLAYTLGLISVASLVFLSGIFDTGPLISAILAALVILVGVIPSIFDFFRNRKMRINQEKKLELLVKNIISFLSNTGLKLNEEKIIDELKAKKIELTIPEVNYNVIDLVLKDLSWEERNILFILSLCNEIERNPDDIIKSGLRKSISEYLDGFDLYRLDENTEKLLCAYSNLKEVIEGRAEKSVSLKKSFTPISSPEKHCCISLKSMEPCRNSALGFLRI